MAERVVIAGVMDNDAEQHDWHSTLAQANANGVPVAAKTSDGGM